jgi:F-type H+-transporting ATPase subunit delta
LSVLARRYAAALVDVAIERKSAEAFKTELAAFAGAYAISQDLRNFLATPAISREAKQGVIEKLAERIGVGEAVRNFLFVIADNRRMEDLGEIRQAFEIQLNERLGIAEAAVTSARELSNGEKEELTRALAHLTGKRIEAEYSLDEKLIGGAVVRIGSTIYDGSVREQLNRLRTRLESE